MSQDTQAKIKQLTDKLYESQSKITSKKKENDEITKRIDDLAKELTQLSQQAIAKKRDALTKLDKIAKEREEKERKITDLKRIVGSDKATLEKEKGELQATLDKVQAEAKKLQENKFELLQQHKFDSVEEDKKVIEEVETEETLESVCKGIEVKKNSQGFLTVETITNIIEGCSQLCGKKFKEQVSEQRKKLRAKGGQDLEAYLDASQKELGQHTQAYQTTEKEVLDALKVEKSFMDKSIEYYMQQRNVQILTLMNMLGEKMKSFITGNKKINKEQFKEIAQAKIQFIKDNCAKIFSEDNRRLVVQKSFGHMQGSFEEKEEMSMIVLKNFFEFKLGCFIHEKFQVEDEDIRDASQEPEIQLDVEIAQLLNQIEEVIYENLPKPGKKEAPKKVEEDTKK